MSEYVNKYDRSLSALVSYPDEIIKRNGLGQIEYIGALIFNAYNAGVSMYQIGALIELLNEQIGYPKLTAQKINTIADYIRRQVNADDINN